LGPQFDLFIASIDWVAPKPTTFRINEDTSTDVTVDAGGGDEVEVDTTTDVEAEA
jgi:hypothetical protein